MAQSFLFFPAALLILTAGCAATKHTVPAVGSRTMAAGQQTSLTLVLKAEWNPDSSVNFSLYNDIRNEGLLLQKDKPARGKSGFLACFAGASGEHKDSVYISHPLKERVETKTGQGKILNSLFIREEAYTELHVQYTPDMKKLILTDLETQQQQTLDIR